MMKNCKGNALVYVLIAVVLLAALSYAISRDGGGQQINQLSESQVKLLASDLIAHANSAKIAVDQMAQWGIDYDEIKFDKPGTAAYDVDPQLQIYHPSGGGLEVFINTNENLYDPDSNAANPREWRGRNEINVEWGQTTANDLIYTFIDVHPNICAEINSRIIGDPSIPMTTVNYSATFSKTAQPAEGLLLAKCAECEGKKSFCIQNTSSYAFYNIIGSR